MNINSMLANMGYLIQKNSPKILIVGGTSLCLTGCGLGCWASTKLSKVMQSHKDRCKAAAEKNPDAEDQKKATRKECLATVKDLAILYGPTVACEALGVTGILTGSKILKNRNIALATAYTALDSTFRSYRRRVKDRYGEETEKEIYYNLHKEQVEETVVDEKGREKKVKKEVLVSDGKEEYTYGRYFYYGESKAAEPDISYNIDFLKAQNNLFDKIFQANYYLHLNDVYEALGYPKTVAGQEVGWVKDGTGDDHVIFDINKVMLRNEVTGDLEEVLYVDFNVQGPINERCLEMGLIVK